MVRQNRLLMILAGGIAAAVLWASLTIWRVASVNWGLVSTLLLLVVLALLMLSIGRRPADTVTLSVTAVMAALASLGRILFVAVPNVQPATFLILLSGYVFGGGAGFVAGMLTGLIPNFFLGHGPWTLWQMIAWGLCGLMGGALGRGRSRLAFIPFLITSVLAAYFYGLLMNTWHWLNLVYPLTWQTLLVTWASSFVFDTLHGAGNFVFALIFARPFFNHLMRYRSRFLPVDYPSQYPGRR